MFEAANEYGKYPLNLEGILTPEDLHPTGEKPDLAKEKAPIKRRGRPRRR